MKSQAFAAVLAVSALILATGPASAQENEAPSEAAEAGPAPACCTIPARTMVEIEILDRVNSKLSKTGERFAISLAEPLTIDGRLVAPAGTRGVGEVVHAAKAGAAGKAGELILAARYLELGDVRIPLRTFRYGRSQGKDNSGAVNAGNMAAAAFLPVASVLGFLVSGGNVDIPAGTRANAQTAEEMMLAPAAKSE